MRAAPVTFGLTSATEDESGVHVVVRMVVGGACAYEGFALVSGRVPTLSYFCRTHRWFEGLLLGWLVFHLHHLRKVSIQGELDSGVKKRKHGYWWTGQPNFGDQLAPLLLERFAGIKASWAPVCNADIVTIGSVLEHIPPLWSGWVLGAGKLYEDSRLHLHTKTSIILGLRGPLTARQCPPGSYALGDPALLAPELIDDLEPEKLYDLGIVPHWSDSNLAQDERFYGKRWGTRVINPAQDPMTVLREISACQKIVTSSLHGMIVADSFGIPRRFEPAREWGSDQGGMFKFRDYLASVDAPLITGKTTMVSRLRIEDLKYGLYDAYEELGRQVRKSRWLR